MKFICGLKMRNSKAGEGYMFFSVHKQSKSAVKGFMDETSADLDAEDRNERAFNMEIEARYEVCPASEMVAELPA